MTEIHIEPGVLEPIARITATPDWTAQPVILFSGGTGVRLTAGAVGRGKRRESYLIVADTLPDAFRALSLSLEKIANDGSRA